RAHISPQLFERWEVRSLTSQRWPLIMAEIWLENHKLCRLGARVDALLNQRWQSGLSPFDGDCLVTDDAINVEELRELLAVVVPELERGCAGQALYAFDDWHQHDGYVTERRVMEWEALAAVARIADALIASRQGDTYVHRSFYPEGFAFLLRYDVSD